MHLVQSGLTAVELGKSKAGTTQTFERGVRTRRSNEAHASFILHQGPPGSLLGRDILRRLFTFELESSRSTTVDFHGRLLR